MKCPKCNCEINEQDRVCPNCNRVLLLECPICHKLNRSPICEDCGFIIVNRCHNCGKFNQTIIGKCQSCGFDTYVSAALNDAEVEEYGCLVISFPNIDRLRGILKKKSFTNFYNTLKKYIFDYAKQNDIRASIVNDLFVLKCYKEVTTFSSINKAVKSAITLMDKLAEVSYKLKLKKNFKLTCKMTILKRSIEAERKPYNTGLNIKLVETENIDEYMTGLQIITDQHVNNMISRQYKQEMIYSSQIEDELIEFYEFPLSENITPRYEEDLNLKQNILTRPKIIPGEQIIKEQEKEGTDTNKNSPIDFQTNCKFMMVEGVEIQSKLDEILLNKSIIALKYKEQLQIDSGEIYDVAKNMNKRLLHAVCLKGFKYSPYALFVQLIANYLGYDIKLGDLSDSQKTELLKIDKDNLLYNLLTHKKCNQKPKTLQKKYISLFKNFLKLQKNTLIYIENFDLIDETSLMIFEKVFHKFSEYDLTLLVTVPYSYFLHKEIPELMYKDEYKEITIVKSSFDKMLSALPYDLSEVENSYYLNKIKYQCCGGNMYFNQAINYLIDSNLFVNNNDKLVLNTGKTNIVPATLEQLIIKKFELLNQNECYILAYAIYLGANIDIQLLKHLRIENLDDAIKTLSKQGFIYVSNNIVNISNFKLIKACITTFLQDDIKAMLENNIKEYLPKESYNIVKKYEMLVDDIFTIYDLCEYSINKGDFNAYLRNCKRFLNHLYSISDDEISGDLLEAREDIYNILSQYIDQYPSEKIYTIAKNILEDCIEKGDEIKVLKISKLMLESAMLGENYNIAQQSLHRILVRLSNPALTKRTNSNLLQQFVYSCTNVKLLFYTGNLKGCINALDNIIDTVNSNPDFLIKIHSNNKTKSIFSSYLMSVIIYGAISRILLNMDDIEPFITRIETLLDEKVQWKSLILALEKLLHNEEFSIENEDIFYDVTSDILLGFLNSYKYFEKDYNEFVQAIYKIKTYAKKHKENFVNLVCDLLIGYSYQRLGSFEKSKLIFSDVLTISQKSGMRFISVLAVFFLANLKFNMKEYEIALKLVENNISTILNMHCDECFISVLTGILYVNILSAQNKLEGDERKMLEKIDYCCERYNLNYLKELMGELAKQ